MKNFRSYESINEACKASSISTAHSLTEVFNKVVREKNDYIKLWIHGKYKSLPLSDAEDIAQECCVDLWEWCQKQDRSEWLDSDLYNLWKDFCSKKLNHYYKKAYRNMSLDNARAHMLMDDSDDNMLLVNRREIFDTYVDGMKERERELMNLVRDGYSNEYICQEMGLKNKAVLKNVKCRLITKMKRDLANCNMETLKKSTSA